MIESLPPSKKRPLREIFPHASADALDLLEKLLQFDPTKRLSAAEAVMHPYVVQFRDEEEPVCSDPITIKIDDNVKYSISDYRNSLYGMIRARKKEQKKAYLAKKKAAKKKKKTKKREKDNGKKRATKKKRSSKEPTKKETTKKAGSKKVPAKKAGKTVKDARKKKKSSSKKKKKPTT
eukprot:TRINITY_DN11765_c0_g1_i1.p1 TRINITY_DN11765_c0_g1~~TRINITY_DN11765_c0_g1_i1.p1  ORF type:complete len:178 (-),score=51.85 TRINITY_DN11765_c0_g1_i1:90-623(-)